MSVSTTYEVERLVLAWLAQSYPAEHVPLGLIKRTLGATLKIEPREIDAAANAAIARGMLAPPTRDGTVSLTLAGLELGKAILATMPNKLGVGSITPAGEALIKSIAGAFERTLRETAIEWASEAGSDVEPVHVALAAKSLAAGALARAIEEIDARRDKSGDGPAEQKLLSLLWKAPTGAQ